ncbi:MAG: carboxypeptidase-like regulatory domain-containing protein [Prevotellaceae bacterium]|jgi:hypothetical protein|nr:carboxypeptidase-like regulatory domain-containing protein [Prevotellaceae bacterium]
MKKISFFALLSIFALATSSCNKDPMEIVDKTEYDVTIFVEGYSSSSDRTPLSGVEITLIDYGTIVTTDRDGKATLKLQRGEYRITIKKSGYEYTSYYNSFDGEEYTTISVEGNIAEVITLRRK